MDIKSLKDKILQLAIQGKLVPQNENDEPASILVEKIKVQKEQLIKDKAIKKENPYPEIEENEKRFELPKGWEWIRLGTFIRFIGGNQPPKSTFKYEYQDGYIRLIQIRDYKSDTHITYIPIEKAKRFCGRDEVMIGRYGPPIFQILRGIEGAYNVALMKADPIDGITKDYLFYLLKDHLLLRKLEYLASRTCGQDGIDMDTLKSYVIGLPPLEEQKRIVNKIEELFELIDEIDSNKKDLLENISNTRKKVLQLAIQGKLVEQCENDEPASVLLEKIKEEKGQLIKDKAIKKEKLLPEISEEEKSFELPKGWEWCRFGKATICRDGERVPVSSKDRGDRDKIYDYYGASGVIDKIDDYLFDKPLLLIGEDGANLISRSTPIAFIARGKYWVNNHAHVIDSLELITLKYLEIYINAIDLKPFVTGTAQPKLNQANLNQIPITLPPLEEQKRIVAKVDLIMGYLDKLQQEIESQEIILEDIIQ